MLKVRLVMALAAMLLVSGISVATTADTQAAHQYSKPVREARAYALAKIGPKQFQCLHNIVERESHWNPRAHNSRSGAHGIGQAVPASKMKRFGHDYMTNPTTQVKWLLAYVKKYGGACGAWNYWRNHGWY